MSKLVEWLWVIAFVLAAIAVSAWIMRTFDIPWWLV